MKIQLLMSAAAVLGLTVAFGLLCWLAWLSRGDRRIVRHKLRAGAALLALTGAATVCTEPMGETTCYAAGPPSQDRIVMDDADEDRVIALDLSQSQSLTGTVSGRSSTAFSFAVLESDDATVAMQAAAIAASDGAYDEATEEFSFSVDAATPSGSYILRIYADAGGEVDRLPLARYTLNITQPSPR